MRLSPELESELEKYSVIPNLKGATKAVEWLKQSRGIPVSKHALYVATATGQVEYVKLAESFLFSERALMRWVFSQTQAVSA